MTLADILPDAPTTTAAALALFDAAPPVTTEFMIGTWRGAELPTDHPLDGVLAASGWWGKQFVDGETVHPLLFPTPGGDALWAFNPILALPGLSAVGKIPALKGRNHFGAISAMRRVLRTRTPKARLRTTEFRGVASATMIYDQLPINDVFRKLSDDSVLGAMDLRGLRRPYFFALTRDESLRLQ